MDDWLGDIWCCLRRSHDIFSMGSKSLGDQLLRITSIDLTSLDTLYWMNQFNSGNPVGLIVITKLTPGDQVGSPSVFYSGVFTWFISMMLLLQGAS